MIRSFYSLTLLYLLCTAAYSATTTFLPRLPEADTLDTEVSTNRTLTLTRNRLVVVLELDAIETNNVEVAFGVDMNEDGVLDPEEETCALGWDCGAWFISDKTTGEAAIVEKESGRRKLTVTFDFAANRTLHHLEATDNTTSILNPSIKVPRALMSQNANLMRITARGKGQHLERLSMTNTQIGIAFLIR